MVQAMFNRRGKVPFITGLSVTTSGDQTKIVLNNKKPLLDDKQYTIATNDFLAYGGESLNTLFNDLLADQRQLTNITLLQALIDHLKQRFPEKAESPLR